MMATLLTVLMWVGWGLLVCAGGVVTLFMLAFGDEPRTNLAVRRAITPAGMWMVFAVVLGGFWLMSRGTWWSVPLAYALAASPPFVLFGLIALLLRYGRRS